MAKKQLDRLKGMQPSSAEYTVTRTYLEWLVELPWSISTDDHIELKEVRDRLKDKKMELTVTDEVLKFLIDEGYDPVFGARPLKRTIQKHIENVLAEEILSGKFKDGDKLNAELHGGRINFEKAVTTP